MPYQECALCIMSLMRDCAILCCRRPRTYTMCSKTCVTCRVSGPRSEPGVLRRLLLPAVPAARQHGRAARLGPHTTAGALIPKPSAESSRYHAEGRTI